MKVTVEIEDSLDDIVKGAKDELLDLILEAIVTSKDGLVEIGEDFIGGHWLQDLNGQDSITETADSRTPVYNSKIDGLFYLYSDELEQAYKDAGCYDKPPDNYKQVCIYFYIEQELHDYIHLLDNVYKEWFNEEMELDDAIMELEARLKAV